MQILLNSSLPPTIPPEQSNLYTTTCSRLLENLGATPLSISWDDHLNDIANVFSDLARILNENAIVSDFFHSAISCETQQAICQISSLSPLLSLLRILSYTIPSFVVALISPPADAPPPILLTFCDAIRLHVTASNTSSLRDGFDLLAKEALLFLESLALTAPAELIPQYVYLTRLLPAGCLSLSRLSVVIRGEKVLSTLLGVNQPTWLLAHSTRALSILASCQFSSYCISLYYSDMLCRPTFGADVDVLHLSHCGTRRTSRKEHCTTAAY